MNKISLNVGSGISRHGNSILGRIKNIFSGILLGSLLWGTSQQGVLAQHHSKGSEKKGTIERPLDNKFFSKKNNELAKFISRCNFHTPFVPKIVARQKYKELNGKIIEKIKGNSYALYLPSDLTIAELPDIIKIINTFTFGDNLPSFASARELEQDAQLMIEKLQSMKNQNNKDIINTMVSYYFSLISSKHIDKNEEVNFLLDELKNINYASAKNNTDSLLLLEKTFTEHLIMHLYESLLEEGAHFLGELEHLKDSLGMDNLKKKLQTAKNKDIVEQEKITKEVLDIIVQKLANYPRKISGRSYIIPGKNKKILHVSSPAKIRETKNIACVGMSILIHNILNELAIPHQGFHILGHSAIEVPLNGKLYYLDPFANKEAIILQEEHLDSLPGKRIVLLGEEKYIAYSYNTEKMLIGQLLYNTGNQILIDNPNNLDLALEYYEKAGKFLKNNHSIPYKIAEIYLKKAEQYVENYKIMDAYLNKALKYIDDAFAINPYCFFFYKVKASIYFWKMNGQEKFDYYSDIFGKMFDGKIPYIL